MSDSMKQAWRDVEDGFATLGQMMRERYQGADPSAGTDPAKETATTAEAEERVALQAAFDRLVAAGREFGDRAADVVRDDAVKSQARRAASSLNDALAATLEVIGEQVAGLFKRPEQESAPSEVPGTAPLSDDPRQ